MEEKTTLDPHGRCEEFSHLTRLIQLKAPTSPGALDPQGTFLAREKPLPGDDSGLQDNQYGKCIPIKILYLHAEMARFQGAEQISLRHSAAHLPTNQV